MFCLAQAVSVPPDYWPFAVLLLSVGLIVVVITVLRVHAFLALILAAIAAEPRRILRARRDGCELPGRGGRDGVGAWASDRSMSWSSAAG